jgi:Nitrogen permease regulator 2
MNTQLSDYVIVGKHLCKKIIIIKNEDIQYMNYSIAIENAKYFRNSLLFSLGFILRDGIETEPYEPILRKLSLAFLSLEVRNGGLLRIISLQKDAVGPSINAERLFIFLSF